MELSVDPTVNFYRSANGVYLDREGIPVDPPALVDMTMQEEQIECSFDIVG